LACGTYAARAGFVVKTNGLRFFGHAVDGVEQFAHGGDQGELSRLCRRRASVQERPSLRRLAWSGAPGRGERRAHADHGDHENRIQISAPASGARGANPVARQARRPRPLGQRAPGASAKSSGDHRSGGEACSDRLSSWPSPDQKPGRPTIGRIHACVAYLPPPRSILPKGGPSIQASSAPPPGKDFPDYASFSACRGVVQIRNT
jgi:hypothetical protein